MTISLIVFGLILCLLKVFLWFLERSERNRRRTRIILSRQFRIQRPISIQIKSEFDSFEGRAMLSKAGDSAKSYGSTDRNSKLTGSAENVDVKCVICIEHFKEGEELVILICGHVFHEFCIMRWLDEDNVCPVCRTCISESDLEFVIETISMNDLWRGKVTSV